MEHILTIPGEFDRNGDGIYDRTEGLVVVTGGVDTSTGLPLGSPLLSTGDGPVASPLTTLIVWLADEEDLTIDEAETKVLREFGGATEDAWTGLCHLMFNRKEFIYVF